MSDAINAHELARMPSPRRESEFLQRPRVWRGLIWSLRWGQRRPPSEVVRPQSWPRIPGKSVFSTLLPWFLSLSSVLTQNGRQLGALLPPRRSRLSPALVRCPSVAGSPASLTGHPRPRVSMKTHYLPALFCGLSAFLEAGGLSIMHTLKRKKKKKENIAGVLLD